eukprot:COSAG01_NODE_1252_length_11052_cov_503.195380_7_plen_114_part_00
MSRRGCSLPANASGFDPHRALISSRFGQVLASPADDPVDALERVAALIGAPQQLPPELIAGLAPPPMPRGASKPLSAASIGAAVAASLPHDAIVIDEGLTSSGGFWAASNGAR